MQGHLLLAETKHGRPLSVISYEPACQRKLRLREAQAFYTRLGITATNKAMGDPDARSAPGTGIVRAALDYSPPNPELAWLTRIESTLRIGATE